MIIDGHAHLGGEYRDLPSVIQTLDSAGADRVVLCPAEKYRSVSMPLPSLPGNIPRRELSYGVNRLLRAATSNNKTLNHIEQGNEEVAGIAGMSGGRVIQFYWADMRRKELFDDLDSKLNRLHFKGIKLHQSCQPFQTGTALFNDLAEYAAAKNIPVFIHLHSRNEVRNFITAARNHRTIFITGHLIGLEIYTGKTQKAGDNIFFDISCPQLVSSEMIKRALKEFGPGRVIMGSDTPYGINNLSLTITRIRKMNLPDRETEMILGDNLRNILMI